MAMSDCHYYLHIIQEESLFPFIHLRLDPNRDLVHMKMEQMMRFNKLLLNEDDDDKTNTGIVINDSDEANISLIFYGNSDNGNS